MILENSRTHIEQFEYSVHAEKINSWAKKHNFPLPPSVCLPPIGFVVNDAAVGFLYRSDSAMGFVEWVFSNPEKSQEERKASLDILMNTLELVAKSNSVKFLFSTSKHQAFSSILERNGFKETDADMKHYIKGIN